VLAVAFCGLGSQALRCTRAAHSALDGREPPGWTRGNIPPAGEAVDDPVDGAVVEAGVVGAAVGDWDEGAVVDVWVGAGTEDEVDPVGLGAGEDDAGEDDAGEDEGVGAVRPAACFFSPRRRESFAASSKVGEDAWCEPNASDGTALIPTAAAATRTRPMTQGALRAGRAGRAWRRAEERPDAL
jgi:hypothetical protein